MICRKPIMETDDLSSGLSAVESALPPSREVCILARIALNNVLLLFYPWMYWACSICTNSAISQSGHSSSRTHFSMLFTALVLVSDVLLLVLFRKEFKSI